MNPEPSILDEGQGENLPPAEQAARARELLVDLRAKMTARALGDE